MNQKQALAKRAIQRFAYRGDHAKEFLSAMDGMELDAETQAAIIAAMDDMDMARYIHQSRRVQGMTAQQTRRPSQPHFRVGRTKVELPQAVYGVGDAVVGWLQRRMGRG